MRTREYEKFVVDFWTSRRAEEEQNALRQKFIMTVDLVRNDRRAGGGVGVLDKMELSLELGDVLYYVTKIAKSHGLTLNDLMVRNKTKLELRRKYGKQKIESGWLIEATNEFMQGAPMWLESVKPLRWTNISNGAIRFQRKEDAEQVAQSITARSWKVTEHQWG